MSIPVAVPSPLTAAAAAVPALSSGLDVEAERRWQAWKARGLASERAFNHRMKVVAAVVVPLAVAAITTFLMRLS
jgi:hypothetical protein